MRGPSIERMKAALEGRSDVVKRGVEQWCDAPHSDAVWAFLADFCDVFEAVDDGFERAEGRREVFHALRDLANMDMKDLIERQERALRIMGE